MKRTTLDEQIKKRANETVQKSILDCKIAVYSAVKVLLGETPPVPSRGPGRRYAREKWNEGLMRVLEILSSEDNTQGWPSSLWRDAESALLTDILSKMDVVQRTLTAKDTPDEDAAGFPAEEIEEK